MAAGYDGKTVKQGLLDLTRVRLGKIEKWGILPIGMGLVNVNPNLHPETLLADVYLSKTDLTEL